MIEQGAFDHLQGFLPRLRFYNKGTGGETADEVLARMQTDVYSLSPKIAIIDVGLNDILEDVALATIQTNITALRDGCRERAIKPVFCLMQPFATYASWSAAREDKRLALDAFVRTLGEAWFSYEATTGEGSPPSLKAAYDSGDHLHLNNAGDVAVSNAAYQQIFNSTPV